MVAVVGDSLRVVNGIVVDSRNRCIGVGMMSGPEFVGNHLDDHLDHSCHKIASDLAVDNKTLLVVVAGNLFVDTLDLDIAFDTAIVTYCRTSYHFLDTADYRDNIVAVVDNFPFLHKARLILTLNLTHSSYDLHLSHETLPSAFTSMVAYPVSEESVHQFMVVSLADFPHNKDLGIEAATYFFVVRLLLVVRGIVVLRVTSIFDLEFLSAFESVAPSVQISYL